MLADGTKITQGSATSKNGQWPLYVPLYGGQGFLTELGDFYEFGCRGPGGDVNWLKPLVGSTKAYPLGFTNTTSLLGSSYVRPAKGAALLGFDNGSVVFNGGALDQSFTNSFGLDSGSRVSNQSDNKLTMKFSTGNGLFSGSVQDPNSSLILPFKGVVLQRVEQRLRLFPRFRRERGSLAGAVEGRIVTTKSAG